MDIKEKVLKEIDNAYDELKEIKQYLYDNPETGGYEVKSSVRIMESLKKHGFSVEKDFMGIEHSFRAEYVGSKKGPVIGIMCEYDALPGMGHACGHNIICTMGLGAAYGLKPAVDELGGTIVVYGTPGEECLVTKVQMAENHGFDELDVAMMAHPNASNVASCHTMGIDAVQIEFNGVSAHAGVSPEEGKNALDAAVLCYSIIGFEKQYLSNTNIYGIMNSGGEKASAIPDYASIKYLLRTKYGKDMKKVNDLIRRAAESAALATGTTCHLFNNEPSNKDMITNETMSEVFNRCYQEVSGEVMAKDELNGSTDMGDVSYVVPAIHPWLGLGCEESIHNPAFAGHTIEPTGDRVMVNGGKGLALTGLEILSSPELLQIIKAEYATWKENEEK